MFMCCSHSFVLMLEMAQYDSGAAALVKKSHNLVAPSLELSVNKTTILEGKHQKNTGCFLVIIF